jgi:hypothetical protein
METAEMPLRRPVPHSTLARSRNRRRRLEVERLEDRCTPSSTTAIISNGTIELGLNAQGDLNVPGGSVASNDFTTLVGLRYVPTNADAASPGDPAEGWGVSGVTPQGSISGFADVGQDGVVNLSVVSFTFTAQTAVSSVDVGSSLQVTQDYHPSALTPNLYEDTVTITNLTSTTIQDVRYRRVVDWDVTGFDEFVTNNLGTTSPTVIGNRPAILDDTNDGFETANPLGPNSGNVFPAASGNFDTFGPSDQGTLFDLGFGSLAAHSSLTFHLYYGAAGSQADALKALNAVGAEAYSLAKPTVLPNGPTLGTPNTFILAFTGLGGEAAVTQTQRTVVPPGGTGTVQALSTSGVTATLSGGDGVVLIAATLDVPPVHLPVQFFNLTDIQTIGNTTGATLLAKFYYPTTVSTLTAETLGVFDFNAKLHTFEKVMGVGSDGKPAAPQLVPGLVTVDGQQFGGFFQVTLNANTTPALPLEGTVFAITLANAFASTTVVSPSTASTSSTPTGSAVNFTSTTQLSLSLTAASSTRTSAGGITLSQPTSDTVIPTTAPANTATSTATTLTVTSTTASVGGGSDNWVASLTTDELYMLWMLMEETGQAPPTKAPPPSKPSSRSSEQKPVSEPTPASGQEQSAIEPVIEMQFAELGLEELSLPGDGAALIDGVRLDPPEVSHPTASHLSGSLALALLGLNVAQPKAPRRKERRKNWSLMELDRK